MAQSEIQERASTIPGDRLIIGIETDPMLFIRRCRRDVSDGNSSRTKRFNMNALEFYSPLCKILVNLLHESAGTTEKEIAVRTRHEFLDCVYPDSYLTIIIFAEQIFDPGTAVSKMRLYGFMAARD